MAGISLWRLRGGSRGVREGERGSGKEQKGGKRGERGVWGGAEGGKRGRGDK